MRLETGVFIPANDWPGVFIRGDNALSYAMALRSVLAGNDDLFAKMMVEGLANLLQSCRADQVNPDKAVITITGSQQQ
jgi:hypothetical protein